MMSNHLPQKRRLEEIDHAEDDYLLAQHAAFPPPSKRPRVGGLPSPTSKSDRDFTPIPSRPKQNVAYLATPSTTPITAGWVQTEPSTAATSPPPLIETSSRSDGLWSEQTSPGPVKIIGPALRPRSNFWLYWRPREYDILAEYMCWNFDATNFSRATGKPTQEMLDMVSEVCLNLRSFRSACLQRDARVQQRIDHYLAKSRLEAAATATATTTAKPQAAVFAENVHDASKSRVREIATATASQAGKQPQLDELPEIADRFVPQISIDDGTEHVNPYKYCPKPKFWTPWTKEDFSLLADCMSSDSDYSEFAQKIAKPVEEVALIVNLAILDQLRDSKKVQGHNDRMQERLDQCEAISTPTRCWSNRNGGKKMMGELTRVSKGVVELVGTAGTKEQLKLGDLSDEDMEYLRAELSKKDKFVLFGKDD